MNVLINTNYSPTRNLYKQNKSSEQRENNNLKQQFPSFTGNPSSYGHPKSLIRKAAGRIAVFLEKKGIIERVCPFQVCPLKAIADEQAFNFMLRDGKYPFLHKIAGSVESLKNYFKK